MSQYKVDFGAMAWESPIDGMRFKAVKHRGTQLRLVEYSKALEPHWCEKGHIGYVLEGKLEIEFENEVFIYGPGDGVYIPNGKEHQHKGRVLTDVVRVIFVEDAQ